MEIHEICGIAAVSSIVSSSHGSVQKELAHVRKSTDELQRSRLHIRSSLKSRRRTPSRKAEYSSQRYYYNSFGNAARRCRDPCSWQADQGQNQFRCCQIRRLTVSHHKTAFSSTCVLRVSIFLLTRTRTYLFFHGNSSTKSVNWHRFKCMSQMTVNKF